VDEDRGRPETLDTRRGPARRPVPFHPLCRDPRLDESTPETRARLGGVRAVRVVHQLDGHRPRSSKLSRIWHSLTGPRPAHAALDRQLAGPETFHLAHLELASYTQYRSTGSMPPTEPHEWNLRKTVTSKPSLSAAPVRRTQVQVTRKRTCPDSR